MRATALAALAIAAWLAQPRCWAALPPRRGQVRRRAARGSAAAAAEAFDVVDDFAGDGKAYAVHPGAVSLALPEGPPVRHDVDTFSPGFVVDRVLTHEACQQLVDLAEGAGFSERWSQSLGVCTLFVDEAFERGLFERLRPLLPNHMGGTPIGINRRWAVIKYGPGQYMNAHVDGHVPGTAREGDSLVYDRGTRSYMTALFWLSDDVQGGETVFTFPQGGIWVKIPPRTGAALLFNHGQNAVSNPLHYGGNVDAGVKYLVRSDVIYGHQ